MPSTPIALGAAAGRFDMHVGGRWQVVVHLMERARRFLPTIAENLGGGGSSGY
jgi:hypothetical protein